MGELRPVDTRQRRDPAATDPHYLAPESASAPSNPNPNPNRSPNPNPNPNPNPDLLLQDLPNRATPQLNVAFFFPYMSPVPEAQALTLTPAPTLTLTLTLTLNLYLYPYRRPFPPPTTHRFPCTFASRLSLP